MTADAYLQNILNRERVDTGPQSPVRGVHGIVLPHIQQWAGQWLIGMTPSGSFAKGTANQSGTDIDLFISLSADTPSTLKQIYDTLCTKMTEAGATPRRQNVSINVSVLVNSVKYSVDLVPAKQQDGRTQDHSLYRSKADTWTKTNVANHIRFVSGSGRIDEIRILKLWRNQAGLEFPSFYLEAATIAALAGARGSAGVSTKVWTVFEYLRDKFENARVVDPANTNNILSDDLTVAEKKAVRVAATRALAATDWNQIVR